MAISTALKSINADDIQFPTLGSDISDYSYSINWDDLLVLPESSESDDYIVAKMGDEAAFVVNSSSFINLEGYETRYFDSQAEAEEFKEKFENGEIAFDEDPDAGYPDPVEINDGGTISVIETYPPQIIMEGNGQSVELEQVFTEDIGDNADSMDAAAAYLEAAGLDDVAIDDAVSAIQMLESGAVSPEELVNMAQMEFSQIDHPLGDMTAEQAQKLANDWEEYYEHAADDQPEVERPTLEQSTDPSFGMGM